MTDNTARGRFEHMLDNPYQPVTNAGADQRIAHALEYIAGHIGRISATLNAQEVPVQARDLAQGVFDILEAAKSPSAAPEEIETAKQIKQILGIS